MSESSEIMCVKENLSWTVPFHFEELEGLWERHRKDAGNWPTSLFMHCISFYFVSSNTFFRELWSVSPASVVSPSLSDKSDQHTTVQLQIQHTTN